MKKRNLAAALAVLAISGAVVPMTANAATAEPYNIINYEDVVPEVRGVMSTVDLITWAKNADIARKENESEYDYYLRLRDYVASTWTITTEVPKSVAQATEYVKAYKADNHTFYCALMHLLNGKSDLMYDLSYLWHHKDTSGNYRLTGAIPTRYTEMENAYGQMQTIPSTFSHSCNGEHRWWEKDIFGVIRLDGKLYAMKMTADSATCGTLIPYEELGYNCNISWGWDTDMLKARGYQLSTVESNGKYVEIEIYDADGSYDWMEAWGTESQWATQGVLLYYCKDGKITPMTKAVYDTLPDNTTHCYDQSCSWQLSIPAGWKLFAD